MVFRFISVLRFLLLYIKRSLSFIFRSISLFSLSLYFILFFSPASTPPPPPLRSGPVHTLATETVFHNADIMHTRLREFELQLPKADAMANFRAQLGKSISTAKQVLGLSEWFLQWGHCRDLFVGWAALAQQRHCHDLAFDFQFCFPSATPKLYSCHI